MYPFKFNIYYIHNLESKRLFPQRPETSILKITKEDFLKNSELIQQSIDSFNSEISWNEMWDLHGCELRLNQNQTLYLLLEIDLPIGHVWYDMDYLYNAFVSKKRHDGDSAWFIQETMWDMKEINNLNSIKLYTDEWNIKSQKFWEKLGYTKI